MATTFEERYARPMFYAGLILSVIALLLSAIALAQPAQAGTAKFDWVTINYVAPGDSLSGEPDCGKQQNYAGRTYIGRYSTLMGSGDEYMINLRTKDRLYVCKASFKVLR